MFNFSARAMNVPFVLNILLLAKLEILNSSPWTMMSSPWSLILVILIWFCFYVAWVLLQRLLLSKYFCSRCQEEHMSFFFYQLNWISAQEQSGVKVHWSRVLAYKLLYLDNPDVLLQVLSEKHHAQYVMFSWTIS